MASRVSLYDGGVAREFARRIKVGMVGINVPFRFPWHGIPSERMEAVAVRRPSCLRAPKASAFYTRYKSIMQRWSDSITKGAEFTMPVAK